MEGIATKTTWPDCDICGKPTTTEDGFLSVDYAELHAYDATMTEWEKAHPGDDRGLKVLDVVRLAEMPRRVPWRWGHSRCLPQNDYWIEAGRIDTIAKAMSWTLHLMEKNWFDRTGWALAVRRLFPIPSV